MSRRAGYTLIELMIVVAIIGFSAIAFAPGIGRANGDRRVSTVARELIRVGRRARADTFGYLRAHVLWIDPANGVVQLIRGVTNSCTISTAAWTTLQATCGSTSVVDQSCPENLTVTGITNDANIYMYQETLSGTNSVYAQTPVALCYAPSGVVLWATGANFTAAMTAGFSNLNTVGGGFVYSIHKASALAAPLTTSRVHRVLFPLGGNARSLR